MFRPISTTLALLSLQIIPTQASKFHLDVHLPINGDCSQTKEINPPESLIRDGDCQTYDEFRAFWYRFGNNKVLHGPYKYGLCSVKVFSEPTCTGQELISIVDGNNYNNSARCHTDEFKQKPGRSVKVEKCVKRPKDMPKTPPSKDRPQDFPVEWPSDYQAYWRLRHGKTQPSSSSTVATESADAS